MIKLNILFCCVTELGFSESSNLNVVVIIIIVDVVIKVITNSQLHSGVVTWTRLQSRRPKHCPLDLRYRGIFDEDYVAMNGCGNFRRVINLQLFTLFMYISIYIHACMHAYIHTYIHACMHAYTHARMHARTHAHTHTHT